MEELKIKTNKNENYVISYNINEKSIEIEQSINDNFVVPIPSSVLDLDYIFSGTDDIKQTICDEFEQWMSEDYQNDTCIYLIKG